jgi:hypothetical protein
MSPERSTLPAAPPPQTAVPSPSSPATPFNTQVSEPSGKEPTADLPAPPSPTAVEASAEPALRYLIPFSELVLPGEYANRSWSIYLTPEQAEANATLNVGYQNAIVVAPEISHLRLTINGTRLVDAPIASPDNPSGLSAVVPAGVLHAGMNDVTVEAVQRHRTDCTIESTYELWTQLSPEGTYLTFENGDVARWKRVEDVRSIGVNDAGATKFSFMVPAAEQVGTTPVVIRLAQSLALMTNMPNQSFTVTEDALRRPTEGEANVVLGTASELAGLLATLPPGAETVPTVGLVDDPNLGSSTVVVTGPTWQAVEMAVDGLAKQVDRPVGTQRTSLQTRLWRTPDVPMLFGAAQLKFGDLGVNTLEFSGRRVRTDFAVGIPADFYATAYGQATILLDAAYSPEVLPGSRIDIYVNDNIAATVPITASGGEILKHLPIKVTMRHFRPGENIIALEAVLITEADRICAPGATALDNGRFVVFDSSEFVMPDFARIGRTPELASLGGTAFPYNRVEYPIPLILDRAQPESLSAATTLLARMAVAASRLIPVDTSASVASIGDKDAIFLSTISQVPPAVLAQVGVSDESRSTWGETVASVKPDTQVTFDQWRERLRGSGWRGQVSRFEEWMSRTFNVSMDTFRVFRADEPAFAPGGNASLLVASNYSPSGSGSWTLISAPTVGALKEGIDELTNRVNWRQMGGHITTLNPATNGVSRIATEEFEFIETVPFSLRNYRLIAANWLSTNALSYGLALTLLSIALGLATAGLLRTFGRRD